MKQEEQKPESMSLSLLDQAANLIHARESQKTQERRARQIASLAQHLRTAYAAEVRKCSFSQAEKELENSDPPEEWFQLAEVAYALEFGGDVPELMTAKVRTNRGAA